MSSGAAHVALLPSRARRDLTAQLRPPRTAGGRWLRLASFVALGLFGTLSWASLLNGSGDELRLLGLLALATALAVIGVCLPRRRRLLLVPAGVLGLLVAFAISGVPLSWISHFRIAVTARAIGNGLSALPTLLVPYGGINPWVRIVIVLGAGVLLLDAAILFALAPQAAGQARRAVAALPLVALATIPTTVVHPRFVYVDGMLLFLLLAGFMWSDRIDRHEVLAAVGLCAASVAAALLIAPALDRHSPWINYQSLASKLVPGREEAFDWTQTYGPIVWPRHGQTVLDVQAGRPDYWKAEDLDAFDGRAWTSSSVMGPTDPLVGISSANLRRWTQTLQVTLSAMDSSDVIAAGVASQPVGLQTAVLDGAGPGTWVAQTGLARGDSYRVKVYDPQPTPIQLAGAGTDYPPGLLPAYLTLSVPEPDLPAPSSGSVVDEDAVIPPFGSPPGAAYGGTAASPASVLTPSPYAAAYALARSLVRRSQTPYAYALSVEHYLDNGAYAYRENTRQAAYPLESFLFKTKAGYCQQFAGAMALLLRLGGVPARLAVGFTTGTYDSATKQWMVSDSDAHAWVEVYFPGYGWVRFDPTPPVDPALHGLPPNLPVSSGLPVNKSATGPAHNRLGNRNGGAAPAGRRSGTSGWSGSALLLGLLGLAALGGVALAVALVRPPSDVEAKVAELERAFARTGRPLSPSTTLAAIERRFADTPVAGAYVRGLVLERFAGSPATTTSGQRRALRAGLRRGLGVSGMVRAWWALPPRRSR